MTKKIVVVVVIIVAALFVLNSVQNPVPVTKQDELKKFASYDELKSFLNRTHDYSNYGFAGDMAMGASLSAGTSLSRDIQAASAPQGASQEKASDYSTTNVQVQGVDEADIVKNDGKYIYVVSGTRLVIVDAYPADAMSIVSEINFTDAPQEIFVNGDRLVVFGNEYTYYSEPVPLAGATSGSSGVSTPSQVEEPTQKIASSDIAIMPSYRRGTETSYIKVYDITDRSNPVLAQNMSTDGYYFNSRMIGDYVYAIINEPVYNYDIGLPVVRPMQTAFPDIYYFDVSDRSYNFVNIVAVNVKTGETNNKVFLLPYSQNLFVSNNNIYVTYTKWLDQTYFMNRLIDEVILPAVPADVSKRISDIRGMDISNQSKLQEMYLTIQNYLKSLSPEQAAIFEKDIQTRMENFQKIIAKEQEKTIINKISINNGQINYENQASVPGTVLNQFSMDEYNGYFRIATTVSGYGGGSQSNNMYVLDSSMKQTGKVEDLASGERIYSARFMGDRAYMVTFRQVDPLFVIDLKDPANPTVLGYLKVTGVSDYLHPVDENHIIGIGKETTEQGRFLGLKMSLFDVSDVANPKEISKIIIGDRGTDSQALNDHKAFLFDKDKGLLVLPVLLAEINTTKQQPEVPVGWPVYGNYVFQGAYVFDFSVENGFTLRGRITHAVNETDNQAYWGQYAVKRSLYIGDVLYTVSGKLVKANNLSDLNNINKIDLPSYEEKYPLYGYI
ncbi:MAG: beta-propeller domain-containing protein [Candidatus Aenigmarchaeota archaeon]|nr:beta-propeller domain-containing protein [Candidatus Aenigmarchaeota archaeon]